MLRSHAFGSQDRSQGQTVEKKKMGYTCLVPARGADGAPDVRCEIVKRFRANFCAIFYKGVTIGERSLNIPKEGLSGRPT